MEYTNKNVLIISHNPLSRVNNNGKTLVSIFKGIPQENIYQIYLNSDTPDYSEACHYLQLNEKQIISSVFKMKNLCCQEIQANPSKVSSAIIKRGNFANHTKRLLRECVWKIGIWKENLRKWLADKRFDVVFFMAGDGIFAYDVYRFVMSNISAKGCMFFTDDYIIGSASRSFLAYLRRGMLKKKIKKILPIVEDLYVISDEMKDAYFELFGVDSYIIRNFSVEKKEIDNASLSQSRADCLTMVYAGGLHYNRWKVLAQVANALDKINREENCRCDIKIYSSQKISNEIVATMNVPGSSEFCGAVSAFQIAEIYASADILLHVESFEKKAIASTKYSFSTKIPEYLSAGKCVLAVGPGEVASVRYLSNFACVICNNKELLPMLNKIINDSRYREFIASNCKKKYEKDFSVEKQQECLSHILSVP